MVQLSRVQTGHAEDLSSSPSAHTRQLPGVIEPLTPYCTHRQRYMHRHTDTDTHRQTHRDMQIYTQRDTLRHAIHTHTERHTQTHTSGHTQTQTHTIPPHLHLLLFKIIWNVEEEKTIGYWRGLNMKCPLQVPV